MCALQHMAEASVGQRWITERGIRVPKITRVVEIFLNATRMWVSPNIIWQCWPMQRENTPVQNLDGMRQSIVCKLDETAMQCTSSITWDQFAFPQMDQEYWREEALCYCSGKTIDIGTRMLGFRLMLQDDKGQYPHSSHALIFEGYKLVYDPQQDTAQWVPHKWFIGTMYRNYHHSVLTVYLYLYLSRSSPKDPVTLKSVACMSYKDLCMPSQA